MLNQTVDLAHNG